MQAYGLGAASTDLQIAAALMAEAGTSGAYAERVADRDRVAADDGFMAAWRKLAAYGVDEMTPLEDLEAALAQDGQQGLAVAVQQMLGDGGMLERQEGEPAINTMLRSLLQSFLSGRGLTADSSPEDVEAAFDTSATLEDLLAAQEAVSNAAPSVLAAHQRLRAQGLDGFASDIDIASPLVDATQFGRLKYYRSALAANAGAVPAAVDTLAALGLSATSTEAELARKVIDGERFDALKEDLAAYREYALNRIFTISYVGGDFNFDFDFEKSVVATLPFDLDLADLADQLGDSGAEQAIKALIGAGGLLEFQAAGELEARAFARAEFGFQMDLSDIFAPRFLVDERSGITLGASVGTADGGDIDASLSFGGLLTAAVIDGTASASLTARLGLAQRSGGGGQYAVSELVSLGLDAFDFTVAGDLQVDLPVYFPIESMPLGGSTADRNGDGFGDNVLHIGSGFDNHGGFQGLEIVTPDLAGNFDLFAFLNDPGNILRGLEGFFDGLDKIADGIDFVELPLIGGAPFDDLAASIRGIRAEVLGAKSGGDYLDGLGKWLQDLDRDPSNPGVAQAVLEMIRTELFNALSPLNSEMFALVVPVLGPDGELQYDARGKLVTRVAQSAEDIELKLIDKGVAFNIRFGGVLVGERDEATGVISAAALPIDFSAGIPGIDIAIDASLLTTIDYLMGIGLAISATDGIYLDTRGVSAAGEEIVLDISAELDVGDTAKGTLGFLAMQFEVAGATGLHGHFGLDLADFDNDGKLKFGESASLALNANATAQADIKAHVDTIAGDLLPSVETRLKYDQLLGRVSLSTNGGLKFESGTPQLTLEDVTLDVGSIFESFLGNALDTIDQIVSPLKPVVDLLTMEIDLGFTKVQFIDIAYLKLPAKVVDTAKKVLEVLKSTIEFVEMARGLADSGGKINFGTFNLGASMLEDPDAAATEEDAAQSQAEKDKRTAGMTAQQKKDLETTTKGPSQKGLTPDPKKSAKAPKNTKGSAFSIPILDDPMTVLDFVLGKGDATLFYYDLPDLELIFEYSKTFPVFPGLNVGLKGAVGATTNFDFGYDTRGLREWMDRDFDPAESWRLFNGFFLDDHGQENTPDDQPEVTLFAQIAAIASLGIGGLVEAGVEGGLIATIDFDLNDKETTFLNDTPVGDGKMYGSELIERILHGPQCLFDVHGELRAYVEAFLWIGLDLGFSEITIFEARERFIDEVIAEFDWECIHDSPSDIAIQQGDVLTLRYGDTTVPETYTVDVLDVNDDLTLANLANGFLDTEFYSRAEENALRDQLANWRATKAGDKVIVVSTGVRANVYLGSEIDKLVILGSANSDRYILKRLNGVVSSIDIHGGGNDDLIELYADTKSSAKLASLTIDGDAGDDRITVDSAMLGLAAADKYTIKGGAGKDVLRISGKGEYSGTFLSGDLGDDTLFGGESADHIDGGRGFDVIFGYGGADRIYGGDENEVSDLATYLDADGRTQVSRIYQPDGSRFAEYGVNGKPKNVPSTAPFMVRSFQGDVIDGGIGNDEIHGGQGYDRILGGDGNNTIFGDSGRDVIDAGTGISNIDGGADDDVISWVYAGFTGNGPTLRGGDTGQQDGDTIDVRMSAALADQSNAVTLVKDASGDAKMTVGGGIVFLVGIENVKIDVGGQADDLDIGDLLDTSIQTVDVTLGQRKATMWQAERADDGNYQVYPDDFSKFTGDASYQVGSYFYRYDLADGGQFLFNADGSPRLEKVTKAATVDATAARNAVQRLSLDEGLERVTLFYGLEQNSTVVQGGVQAATVVTDATQPENAVQRFWLAPGINRTTLFYGYDDDAALSGRTAQNSITLTVSDDEVSVRNKLQAVLGSGITVTVKGTGSQQDPFEAKFTRTGGGTAAFGRLAQTMVAADVEAAIESIAAVVPMPRSPAPARERIPGSSPSPARPARTPPATTASSANSTRSSRLPAGWRRATTRGCSTASTGWPMRPASSSSRPVARPTW